MSKQPKIRTGYNYDRDEVSRQTGLECTDESLAVQSQKDEADINVLVRRFGLGAPMPQGVKRPMHGDFTEVTDFRSAMQAVREAAEAFMELPADTRARFHNDPAEFVDFCSDEDNLPEMRKMGLAVPAVEKPPLEFPRQPERYDDEHGPSEDDRTPPGSPGAGGRGDASPARGGAPGVQRPGSASAGFTRDGKPYSGSGRGDVGGGGDRPPEGRKGR